MRYFIAIKRLDFGFRYHDNIDRFSKHIEYFQRKPRLGIIASGKIIDHGRNIAFFQVILRQVDSERDSFE